jgi:multiple sugar transport system substrate-binding protein
MSQKVLRNHARGGQAGSAGQAPGLSRRALLHAMGITLAGLALTRCAPTFRSTPRPAGQIVNLVYQDWRTDWFPPMAQEALKLFHQNHPDIRVFYTPDPENLEDKMLEDMQAGTAADVFQGCCTHFPIWAQQGYTLNLQPFVARDLDKQTIDDWDGAQYRYFFTSDGQQYALPKYHGALALYYNKDLLDSLGIRYPDRTWDYEVYLQTMRQVTAQRPKSDGGELWGSMLDVSWDRLQVYANAWGGRFVDPRDARRCRMADPEAVGALEWVRARMWDDKVMATPLDVHNMGTQQAFVQGKLAMVEDGSWSLKSILSAAPFRVGVTILPEGPVRRVTLATTDGFGIYKGTKYRDAAWELVKFLISEAYGRAMARAHLLQPARASLVKEWIAFVGEQFPEKAAEMDVQAFADGHTSGYSVTTEIFANMVDARRIADAAWDRIFMLGQAKVDIMEQVCQDIEKAQH